ncbi:MAG: cystathionine gamma-synthase family protein [Ignisphaera sp.]
MAGLSTKSIHGHDHRDCYGAHIPPIYTSVVYEYIDYELKEAQFIDRGNVLRYGREENPTTRALERVIAKLEETEDALAFNSGMSAISTVFLWGLEPNTKVVIPMELYSTTFVLLNKLTSKFNIRIEKVYPSAEAIAEAVDNTTSMVFLEIMTNPTNKVIDLEYLANNINTDRIALVVDNTFTTPILVKPIKYKARFILHSMTKYIGGHNDVVGGVVAGSSKDIANLWDWRKTLGGILQPFESYLILRGAKTLEIRFERHCQNAKAIAEFLADHSKVEEVLYPGLQENPYYGIAKKLFEKQLFGGVVSFKVKGSYQDAVNFVKRLKLIKRCPSLGGTESMIVIPIKAGSMHIEPEDRVKLGITENLLRLAVGLENAEDLIEDISRALNF